MYSPIRFGIEYIRYWLLAANGKGHGVHSPFVYDLIERVFNDDRNFYYFPLIEAAKTKVNSNAKLVLTPQKYDQLFFRLVNYLGSSVILELGTSIGITTCYLATANANAEVITLEESTELATLAKRQFQSLGLKNIKQLTGNFNETLAAAMLDMSRLDFVLFNQYCTAASVHLHFQGLRTYLHEDSVVIITNIHRSREMELAWKQIQSDEMVTLTIDLFFIGLVFFRKENKVKQHFSVRF